tara:strand:+ start:572 stop:1162 length:591 start_codon:yes stop_codon:yes gene_type:complete
MKISKNKLKKIILEELRNYYVDLGVNRGQPTDDKKLIKKFYRQKALQHHPDHGGDEDKMKTINAAGQTLLNPERKTKYDGELYRNAIAYKNKNPNANFHGDTGLNLSAQSLKKLADMANISTSQSQSGRNNIDNITKFYKLQAKISKGIHNKFMDAAKQNNLQAMTNFRKLHAEVGKIQKGDFETLNDYSQFAKFA